MGNTLRRVARHTQGVPAARTPRLPAEERRRQLLDAALELLATDGFDAVNVEPVARKAGLDRPSQAPWEHIA